MQNHQTTYYKTRIKVRRHHLVGNSGDFRMEAWLEASAVPMIDCPYCAEPINAKSKKCRHCGEILDAQMREIEMLKRQSHAPQVFMNAGGAAASSASAAAASSGNGEGFRRFPHWFHILMTFVTGGLWLPVYALFYWFRNRRYYY